MSEHSNPPSRRRLSGSTSTQQSQLFTGQLHAGNIPPKPIRLGERAVGWRLSEIDEWLDTRKRASFDREG